MKVVKRENYKEDFNINKLIKAVKSAFIELNKDEEEAYKIASSVAKTLEDNDIVNVEYIQDLIEETLMDAGYRDVAKAYILYRQKRAEKRAKGWELDDLQSAIWEKKYKYNNETFNIWLTRVSSNNAKLKKLIKDKKFLFAGRILAHRNTEKKVTYSNCYVMKPPADNLESIYNTSAELARTFSYGGGCGVDISSLRPNGAVVNNSAKTTSGAVSFMQLFDLTTSLIGQNGRRGALMISIADNHPDIPEFLDIKTADGSITKANISVRISNAFMKAVEEDAIWTLKFTVKDTGEVITRDLKARDLYRKLCENNNNWAEPGLLFWDRIENWHLMSHHPEHKYAGVNPCAEAPLMENGACLLGSINLSAFVKYAFTDKACFDFDKYRDAVRTAVRGLNEVLDEGLERHPLPAQVENAYLWRAIGLGPMAIGDLLIKMGIRYGSFKSLELNSELAHIMLNEALTASALLAKEQGTFPKFSLEALEKSPFYISNVDEAVKELIRKHGLRNSQLLAIAPTGSISTMLGISGGIEPLFAVSYTRKTESLYGKDHYFTVYAPVVKALMEKKGIEHIEDLPSYVVTSHELDYISRIKMQSVWQQKLDASISSTINLPNSATVEDVEDIYMTAWKYGLKGVTVFRDGCSRTGILTVDKKEEKNAYMIGEDKYKNCPECGEPVKQITNGCAVCQNCGETTCG